MDVALAPFGLDHGPLLAGPFAPVADESSWTDLPLISGALPQDLNGVFLRTGPNPRFAPIGRYHPFDGDGMVHAAEFRHGRVTLRNRWVRTDAWAAEDLAARALHHGIRESLAGRADRPLKDSANTDLVAHNGEVLALWYLSGDAYRIDPLTLATLGKQASIVAGGSKISAHAKVDPLTGELIFFDYGTEPPYLHHGVLDAQGRLVRRVPVPLPGPRLPHDMAITARFSIVHDLPLFHDPAALAIGRHKLDFHPELPSRFGVLPRHGSDVRWFEFSPCFVYHVVNAWEDGDWITMIGCRYLPSLDAQGQIDALRTAKNVAELVMDARLWRWRMNLATGQTEEAALDALHNVEFPAVNDACLGRKTRFAYLMDQQVDRILRWRGVRKYDLADGRCLSAFADEGEDVWLSQPAFAAADRGAAEDDGYVVLFRFDAGRGQQTLDVLDARDLACGPIARLSLPRHVPVGFHGCWVGAGQLRGWS